MKKNHVDSQYLNLLRRIIIENAKESYNEVKDAFTNGEITANEAYNDIVGNKELASVLGEIQSDRTGTGTYKTFGNLMRFDLSKGYPLLTTKKVAYKMALIELLWIISGDTNVKTLINQDVHIWNKDCYKAYLIRNGFHLPDQQSEEWINGQKEFVEQIKECDVFAEYHGNLGPVYGGQWRNFGGHDIFKNNIQNLINNDPYFKKEFDMLNSSYNLNWDGAEGVDQLQDAIEKLKKNPNDRRNLIFAYNPKEIDQQVLPSCLALYQIYVKDNKLSVMCYIRSQDVFLGMPFDIVSGATLTHMLAKTTGYEVGEYLHFSGDTHIYSNHLDAVALQLSRDAKEIPSIELEPTINHIEEYELDHIKVLNYNPHPPIRAKLSV